MLSGAASFNADLSAWDVSGVTIMGVRPLPAAPPPAGARVEGSLRSSQQE